MAWKAGPDPKPGRGSRRHLRLPEGITGFELGMGQPVSFAAQRNQGSDAIYYTTVEGGRFVPIRDWKGWRK